MAELGMFNTTPPKGFGGTVMPGTYVLTELWVDRGPLPPSDGGEGTNPPTPTGMAGRVTVYVTSTGLRFVEARGASGALPADGYRGVTWQLAGTDTLKLTASCPDASVAPKTIGFTAGPSELTLFVDATHRETYARQ